VIEMRSFTAATLKLDAAVVACVTVLLVVVWAATTQGHFWPVHAALPLAALPAQAAACAAGRRASRARAVRHGA
jgi:hypothetical protein